MRDLGHKTARGVRGRYKGRMPFSTDGLTPLKTIWERTEGARDVLRCRCGGRNASYDECGGGIQRCAKYTNTILA